jgi:hypothetical protein
MSNITIEPDKITLQPGTQRCVNFNESFGNYEVISGKINKWLKEHPDARITQMINTQYDVLCLYETSQMCLKSK